MIARPRGASTAAAVLWLACAVWATLTPAAQLSVEPTISGRIEYNDNAALRFVPAASWRYTLEPGVAFTRRSESSELTGRARLAFNQFSNPTVADTTDRVATLAGTRQFERDKLALLVDYYLLSAQSAQVLGQTGVNLGFRQVETLSIAPTWTRNLSSRTSLVTSVGYVGSRFEQRDRPDGATDFSTRNASLGLNRVFGERLTAGASLGWLDFDTRPFTSRSQSWSLNGNATWQSAPRLRWTLSTGIQRIVTEQAVTGRVCPVDPLLCQLGLVAPIPIGVVGRSERNLVPFSVSAEWEPSERERLVVTLTQRLNPTGVGGLSVGVQTNVAYTRAMSPTLDFSLSAAYIRSRNLANVGIGENLVVSPVLNWRLSEAWTGRTGVVYTWLGYPTLNQSVESTGVFASLTYAWPAWQGGF